LTGQNFDNRIKIQNGLKLKVTHGDIVFNLSFWHDGMTPKVKIQKPKSNSSYHPLHREPVLDEEHILPPIPFTQIGIRGHHIVPLWSIAQVLPDEGIKEQCCA
jgi:hypothetical protein